MDNQSIMLHSYRNIHNHLFTQTTGRLDYHGIKASLRNKSPYLRLSDAKAKKKTLMQYPLVRLPMGRQVQRS